MEVCHKTGNGSFHLISININALSAHISHGDGKPGDAIPDNAGFIFGPNCTPTVAPPPELPIGCYTFKRTSGDFFYMGPIDMLGNVTKFHSGDGTCSGTGIVDPGEGIIAAANVTDAQNKCQALGDAALGSAQISVFDLGASDGFVPKRAWFLAVPRGSCKSLGRTELADPWEQVRLLPVLTACDQS